MFLRHSTKYTNTSQDYKIIELDSVLEHNFETKINKARLKFISLLILALCKVKTVNYLSLANAFDSNATAGSSFRRIQRFMADFDLPMKLISGFIFNILPEKENLVLVLDRTNWKFGSSNINILMLGICYKNIAIPIMFRTLDKRGNSDTTERIELIRQFITWFGRDCINCLLADREFVGHHWLEFLNKNNIRYYIRLRKNFKVFCFDRNQEKPVFWLFNKLKKGEFYHHPKIVKINDALCYVSGVKGFDKEGKLDTLILVSFNKPEESWEYYKKRWQIETLFKAFKSSGFNIESTHVTDQKRLEKLFMIVMIALVWCYKIGDFVDQNIKAIKIKKHQRKALSVFKYGLNHLNNILMNRLNKMNISVLQFLSCT
ncbi:IS4 family transposase [Chryseobacterium mucoviscidosis]|uniref:IS4 family transposase n=1 Tax=Chryseobacterium mucoviscidosis TaxID=1945581 RepID=A0A202BWC8_9FLAO|nr:IS4 family transposase [Chryseobacterium mucoviscidosis]OVE55793.1 IS4 family transposase [Chryseobacterium mucoviscidosis]